jgi:hypothetical protein
MVSIIGRRKSQFGTGRVMSHIRMQALLLPRASSGSGAEPTGWEKAFEIAVRWSGSFGRTALRMTVTSAPRGILSGR